MKKLFEIIFEDADLLVINKPAGLVCHPTKTDEYSSLISRVRLHLGTDSRPQLVNRLDRETSGVTMVAKTQQAARELRKLWEQPACGLNLSKVRSTSTPTLVEKEYLAIVHGRVAKEHGVIEAPLGKDEQSRVVIKDCVRPDGAPAVTEFWKVKDIDRTPSLPMSLLRVAPYTGRKHQIRIHLAHLGHPIVGDKLYGGDEDLYLALVEDRLTSEQRERLILPFHALHARQVRLTWRGQETAFRAEPERWFGEFVGEAL